MASIMIEAVATGYVAMAAVHMAVAAAVLETLASAKLEGVSVVHMVVAAVLCGPCRHPL